MIAYAELWRAVSEKKTQLSALYARNLLELFVWTNYCIASAANAKRFSEDSERDLDGLRVIVGKLAQFATQTPEGNEHVKSNIPELYKYVEQLDELVGRDVKFKHVTDAAAEIGPEMAILYKTLNTIFSKLIHPTALVVRSNHWTKDPSELINIFLTIGTQLCLSAAMAIAAFAKPYKGTK